LKPTRPLLGVVIPVPSRLPPARQAARLLLGLALAALAMLAPRIAAAGSYDPVLVIGQATVSGGAPPTLVTLTGAWSFDDIVQVDFPLNVVVSQGSTFVRCSVGAASCRSGVFAPLADGLVSSEVDPFEAAGADAPASRITRLTSHQITIALPPVFDSGPVEVRLYAKLQREGVLFSNTATAGAEVLP
jgi:hypothetical protein